MRAPCGLTALLTVASLAGCDPTPDPTPLEPGEELYGVYALIEAGSDTVTALVVRYPAAPEPGSIGYEPVADATVRIGTPGRLVTLRYAAGDDACRIRLYPGPGTAPVDTLPCYVGVLPAPAAPGEAYDLDADLTGGRPVTGRTTVPARPAFATPAEGASIPVGAPPGQRARLRMSVVAPAGADRLEIALAPLDRSRQCIVQLFHPTIAHRLLGPIEPGEAADLVVPIDASCPPTGAVGALPATLRAVVYDPNYARWARAVLDGESDLVRPDDASAGITGAVGFFGAEASAERRVVILD